MANQQRQRLIPLKKKKTFFFNFISSKAEEEANNTPRKRAREVLETGNVTTMFDFMPSKAEEEANHTPRKRTREVLETGNVTTMFDFMPSKAEEEANNTPRIITRELIETGSARIFDPNNIYYIRSTISHCELSNGELLIPFSVMLLNIFPYMDLEIARSFVNENEVRVKLWDDTENNVPRKYGCGRFTVRKLPDDDYHLSIVTLIKDRGLVIGDKIGLYWHPWNSTFVF